MQWSLFVLILMGQCAFITCRLYKFHFIDETKTWTEAQSYCREHYTDLATLTNKTDMKRLCNYTKNVQSGVWIGLYKQTGTKRKWHWSLPGVEYTETKTNWAPGEPNKNCVFLPQLENDKWEKDKCSHRHKFICYDGKKKSTKKFHFINKEKTWPQAQSYCRKHHTDLVSGRKQLEDDEFKEERPQDDKDLWIGLFRDSWRWSDGSSFSFRYRDLDLYEGDKKCAMIANGKWSSDKCDGEKPFVCYDDHVILINQSMTWVDALDYCRDNHRNLVSITSLNQQRWVQEKAKQADSDYVWLGLRYTCTLDFWFWVTDQAVHYNNWNSSVKTDDCDMSGAMDRTGEHKWVRKNDEEKFNFICFK
ncbi:macrophage mannose receptor 1-like [Centropristis striata]|uniref:macrophage mannose receptor 1-like n=1 Tax=Centropristis striata TaxID=184440 RepID=UPI0027DF1A8D|nr:macrophage mannose receptor 1-like [Centropristis striata]